MRECLASDRTYYINPAGSDSDDGSLGAPWKSPQKAWDYIAENLDLQRKRVFVNVAPGSYSGFKASGYIVGATNAAAVQFVGNPADPVSPPNRLFDGGTSDGVYVGAGSGVLLTGIGFQGYRGVVSADGVVLLGQSWFGPCGHAHMQAVSPRSRIAMVGVQYYINGEAPYHVLSEQAAFINVLNCLGTFAWTHHFSGAFVHANQCGIADFTGSGFCGSGFSATGKRFDIRSSGVVSVNGLAESFLPGNLAGTKETGGQYV